MWSLFLRIVFWWFMSVVKFLVTPFFMIFNPGQEHWTWLETILITSSGAALGLFIFFHGGERLIAWWAHYFGTKRKRTFTPWRRRIIRLKWRAGLRGLMLVSGLISVPVSAILAAKFYRHDSSALPKMIIAFCLWSVVLTTIAATFRWFYH